MGATVSSLTCNCGNVMRDSGEPVPNKAHVLRDQDWEPLWEELARKLSSFAEALRHGRQSEWFAEHLPKWPKDSPAERVVHVHLLATAVRRRLEMYQCDQCGRLWLQRADGSNDFQSFLPENANWQNALASSGP